MTQEEKQLLLKDLCARLPYRVICDMWFEGNESDKITEVLKCGGLMRLMNSEFNFIVKPYLRPMSSMTEDEKEELEKNYVLSSLNFAVYKIHQHKEWYGGDDEECTFSDYLWLIDWLNAHHFDYRGLIPMGLALEAPEDMYKTE